MLSSRLLTKEAGIKGGGISVSIITRQAGLGWTSYFISTFERSERELKR